MKRKKLLTRSLAVGLAVSFAMSNIPAALAEETLPAAEYTSESEETSGSEAINDSAVETGGESSEAVNPDSEAAAVDADAEDQEMNGTENSDKEQKNTVSGVTFSFYDYPESVSPAANGSVDPSYTDENVITYSDIAPLIVTPVSVGNLPAGVTLSGWSADGVTYDAGAPVDLSAYVGGYVTFQAVFSKSGDQTQETEKPSSRTITVVYFDESSKEVGRETLVIEADQTTANASVLQSIPAGYELTFVGDFYIGKDDTVSLKVRKKAEEKQDLVLQYVDRDGNQVGPGRTFTAEEGVSYLNTSELPMPDGYRAAIIGDLMIENGTVVITVEKAVKTVYLNFYDEDAQKQAAETPIEVSDDAETVNVTNDMAPEGYSVVNAGELPIRDGYVYVQVKAAEKKTVRLNFFDEDAYEQVEEHVITVDADATYVNVTNDMAPEGYTVAVVGDLNVVDGYVYVQVRKNVPDTKTVKLNFFDEDEYRQVEERTVSVDPDAVSVNVSDVDAPKGYYIVETGDLPIRDGYVYVSVRKAEMTEIRLNYYDAENKTQAAEIPVEVESDAESVDDADVQANLPEGYEIVQTDYVIRDGYVYVEVAKKKMQTVKLNYFDEEQYKQIKEEEIQVPADATYINTGLTKAPEGYYLVIVGDLPIRDGYVYVQVRRMETRTIRLNYFDEEAYQQVAEISAEVSADASSVEEKIVSDHLPAGYRILSSDYVIRDGYVYVGVKKDEEVKKIVNFYFKVDDSKGKFIEYTPSTIVSFENLDEDQQDLLVPQVEALDGYVFTGWASVSGAAQEQRWDADAKTFGVTGIGKYDENGNASVVMEAQFEKETVETESETETKPSESETETKPTETETTPTESEKETEPAVKPNETEKPDPLPGQTETEAPETQAPDEESETETETEKETAETQKNTEKKDQNSTEKQADTTKSADAVKTGDRTPILPYAVSLVTAAAAFVLLFFRKRIHR